MEEISSIEALIHALRNGADMISSRIDEIRPLDDDDEDEISIGGNFVLL